MRQVTLLTFNRAGAALPPNFDSILLPKAQIEQIERRTNVVYYQDQVRGGR